MTDCSHLILHRFCQNVPTPPEWVLSGFLCIVYIQIVAHLDIKVVLSVLFILFVALEAANGALSVFYLVYIVLSCYFISLSRYL